MTDQQLAAGTKVVEPLPAPLQPQVLIPPVIATLIGSMKDSVPTTGTVATTANPQAPNIVMNIVTPAVAITVRFINLFLSTFIGLLTAAMTPAGKVLYASDFFHTALLCASLSIPGACVGLIKDLVTIFGKLEGKYPLATGSI